MLARLFRPREFTGWHMVAVMVLFFGTIISVNLVLAYFANSSWSGLVVQNSYVESQRFDAQTAVKRRQAALGWTVHTSYEGGVFAVSLADAEGRPIRDVSVEATIGRPTTEREDRTLRLKPVRGGDYAAPTKLGTGLWEAAIAVTATDEPSWDKAVRFVLE
ncbi:MAG TPA: FixH family protein [Aurantimonas sp.]|uniref:FixH family protein n=1 Tax=Aurantimonas marianensis TaxID=2920428 RepID=A0A9X2H4J1_9HYPH|nr:FixH family protein [Aurantimonas marianensis]MCP3054046.1 FixH family protein [Aurantimonas marianensis]